MISPSYSRVDRCHQSLETVLLSTEVKTRLVIPHQKTNPTLNSCPHRPAQQGQARSSRACRFVRLGKQATGAGTTSFSHSRFVIVVPDTPTSGEGPTLHFVAPKSTNLPEPFAQTSNLHQHHAVNHRLLAPSSPVLATCPLSVRDSSTVNMREIVSTPPPRLLAGRP